MRKAGIGLFEADAHLRPPINYPYRPGRKAVATLDVNRITASQRIVRRASDADAAILPPAQTKGGIKQDACRDQQPAPRFAVSPCAHARTLPAVYVYSSIPAAFVITPLWLGRNQMSDCIKKWPAPSDHHGAGQHSWRPGLKVMDQITGEGKAWNDCAVLFVVA